MFLFITPLGEEKIVKKYYKNHSQYHPGDAGLDLFCVRDQIIRGNTYGNKIHLSIVAAAYKVTTTEMKEKGFFLLPRSSTGLRTPLRLSNNMGVIDKGYRGELIALVDNISSENFTVKEGERYFQIVSPGMKSIHYSFDAKGENITRKERGQNGLGSTGN